MPRHARLAPIATRGCLLLALDIAVVDPLGDGFEIVDIPKQMRVAPMRYLVIGYRAVRRRGLADAKLAAALAYIAVPFIYGAGKAAPFGGLVPCTPWLGGAALPIAPFLVARQVADAGRQLGQVCLQCAEFAHGIGAAEGPGFLHLVAMQGI